MLNHKDAPENTVRTVDRYLAYLLFIVSVSVFFYWTKDLGLALLERAPNDNQVHYFMMGLGVCWLGSIILIGQRLRFYLQYYPGLKPYFISITPLLIIPAVWALVELFNYLEV